MKRKVISIIGLALFVGAVAFNFQMNSANNQTRNVTLKNIEALTASAQEVGTGCLCMYQPDTEKCWPVECPECGIGEIVCD